MDIKYRRMIHKIPLIHALCKRIVDINSMIYYSMLNRKHRFDIRLDCYHKSADPKHPKSDRIL